MNSLFINIKCKPGGGERDKEGGCLFRIRHIHTALTLLPFLSSESETISKMCQPDSRPH